jgi:hypothetical protein
MTDMVSVARKLSAIKEKHQDQCDRPTMRFGARKIDKKMLTFLTLPAVACRHYVSKLIEIIFLVHKV